MESNDNGTHAKNSDTVNLNDAKLDSDINLDCPSDEKISKKDDEVEYISSQSSISDSSSDNEDLDTRADVVDKYLNERTYSDSDSDDDEVSLAVKRAKRISSPCPPPDCVCQGNASALSFSPTDDIIAVGNSKGDVSFFRYKNELTQLIQSVEIYMNPLRIVDYASDGNAVFTADSEGDIIVLDIPTGKFKNVYSEHENHCNPVYSMKIIDENLFATGCDDGTLKLWDQRKQMPLFVTKNMTDYVSSIQFVDGSHYLTCTSGDGTLTAFNTRERKLVSKSNNYQSDLTCSGIFRHDTKLVVGTGTGSLLCFNWGMFEQWNDEFPGVEKKKYSVNCMVPITENVVITGSETSHIRATHLYPMRHIGIVGGIRASVECIDISREGTLIAASCNYNTVTFMNVEYFAEISIGEKEKKDNDHAREFHLPSSSGLNREKHIIHVPVYIHYIHHHHLHKKPKPKRKWKKIRMLPPTKYYHRYHHSHSYYPIGY